MHEKLPRGGHSHPPWVRSATTFCIHDLSLVQTEPKSRTVLPSGSVFCCRQRYSIQPTRPCKNMKLKPEIPSIRLGTRNSTASTTHHTAENCSKSGSCSFHREREIQWSCDRHLSVQSSYNTPFGMAIRGNSSSRRMPPVRASVTSRNPAAKWLKTILSRVTSVGGKRPWCFHGSLSIILYSHLRK